MRPLFSVLLLVLVAVACKEPAVVPRDGGEEVADCDRDPSADLCDEASKGNVMFTWARAMCGFMLGCCNDSERGRVAALALGEDVLSFLQMKEPTMLDDAIACRRAIAFSLFARFQSNYEAVDHRRQRFNVEAARECLWWFQQGAAECAPGLVLLDQANEPKACKRLFAPNVAADAGCFEDGDCVAAPDGGPSVCETRTYLFDDGGIRFAVDGVCRPTPQLGETCALPDSSCGTGHYCAFDHVCRARAGVDQVCLGVPCQESAYCNTAKDTPTCSRRRTNFEPCQTAAECMDGFSCNETLRACLEEPKMSPLDIRFEFCLGQGENRVARELPFVPRDGGL